MSKISKAKRYTQFPVMKNFVLIATIAITSSLWSHLSAAQTNSGKSETDQSFVELMKKSARICYQAGQIRESMRAQLKTLTETRLLNQKAHATAISLEEEIAKYDQICETNMQ